MHVCKLQGPMRYDHEQEEFQITAMARYNSQLTQSVHQSTAKTDTLSVHFCNFKYTSVFKNRKTLQDSTCMCAKQYLYAASQNSCILRECFEPQMRTSHPNFIFKKICKIEVDGTSHNPSHSGILT